MELSVKYTKSVIELNAAQLILDTDERHRIEYSLELLLQRITNRLDEILSILARDNMLRKRGKKRVYTLPRINPRAANLNSTDDAQKLGREIQDDVMEILTMPSTLSQREKKTGSKCATMAQTSLMTTQGETVAQVTEKETRPPQARTTQSEQI